MKVKYITIKLDRNTIRKIFLNDILYIKADGAYSTIKLINQDTFLVSRLLKTFGFLTEKFNFYRAKRSYIINIDNSIELEKGKKNTVTLINNEKIEVSAKDISYLQNYIVSLGETPSAINSKGGSRKTTNKLIANITNN